MSTKDGGGEWRVDLLGANVLELAVQDKIVSFCSKKHGSLFTKKDKSEYIAILYKKDSKELKQNVREREFKFQDNVFIWDPEGEDAYLFLAAQKELIRINSIGDSASNDREPMEYNGGFIGIFEEKLAQDVYNHGEGDKSSETGERKDPDRQGRAMGTDAGQNICKEPHDDFDGMEESTAERIVWN